MLQARMQLYQQLPYQLSLTRSIFFAQVQPDLAVMRLQFSILHPIR